VWILAQKTSSSKVPHQAVFHLASHAIQLVKVVLRLLTTVPRAQKTCTYSQKIQFLLARNLPAMKAFTQRSYQETYSSAVRLATNHAKPANWDHMLTIAVHATVLYSGTPDHFYTKE
jgi:hypothetical protein